MLFGTPNSFSMSNCPARADSFIAWSVESIYAMLWLPVGDMMTRMMFLFICFSRQS